MTDRTPHEGERTPEDQLDALLAGNHAELLDSMAEALDTRAGFRAVVAMLRSGGPKAECRGGGSPTPHLRRRTGFRALEGGTPPGRENLPVLELIENLIKDLDQLARSRLLGDLSGFTYIDVAAAEDLAELAEGLEAQVLTRDMAVKILDEVRHKLASLPGNRRLSNSRTTALIDKLATIRQRVIRMFDDVYGNISIEN
ncbi:hypothetical protein [Streptomyces chartreusis]|uniref:hypothetical protein n=1 Tax=Streptomyces chartreusis TaxID=1969 RepID=UPI0035DDC044